jgi:hypothetical protein
VSTDILCTFILCLQIFCVHIYSVSTFILSTDILCLQIFCVYIYSVSTDILCLQIFCVYRHSVSTDITGRCQLARGPRRRSAVTCLLGLWVWMTPATRLSVCLLCIVQVEVSALRLSLVQRSPTECGVSEWDRDASIMRRP